MGEKETVKEMGSWLIEEGRQGRKTREMAKETRWLRVQGVGAKTCRSMMVLEIKYFIVSSD